LKYLKIDPMRFDIIKESTKRGYHDFWKDQPYQRAIYQLNLTLEEPRWSNEQFLEVCQSITIEDVQEYINQFLSELYYEVLVIGNVIEEDAIQTREVLQRVLNAKPLSPENVPKRLQLQLQPQKTYIHALRSFNEVDRNSAFAVHFEVGRYNHEQVGVLDLFAHICYTSCYSQLRTKEQLGYIVHSSSTAQNGVMSFRIIVQSDTKDPAFLDERAEAWIDSLKVELNELKEEEFVHYRNSLVAKILEKDKSLKEEYNRWYGEIQYPRLYQFDRAQKEATEVGKVQKRDIIRFYEDYISLHGKERRKFSVLVYSKDHNMPETFSKDNTIYITNPEEFRKTQSYYVSFNDILDLQYIAKM